MRFQLGCLIFAGLFLYFHLSNGDDSFYDKDKVFELQRKVEHLIEKILNVIENYYHEVKSQFKCIPDKILDKTVNILKSSIDCVDENEKNRLSTGKRNHRKDFLKCFSKAKYDIEETMANIDTTVDHCPKNMTEKTYQINVTTSYTKVFNINIKNGLVMTKKEVKTTGNGGTPGLNNQYGNDSNARSIWNAVKPDNYDDDEDDIDDHGDKKYFDAVKAGGVYFGDRYQDGRLGKQQIEDQNENPDLSSKPNSNLKPNSNTKPNSNEMKRKSNEYPEKSKLSAEMTIIPEYLLHRLIDYGS